MAESLSVKYRPKSLDDSIMGQDSIIKILKRQLELGEFSNTYLFNGASGCGKTTTARAFAKAINHNQGTPIEIDAASNNGVDNVKEIVRFAAERSLDSEYKIYIIDECHSLTSQSWQAFLKCIEEPPKYTIFIFCTTEKNKVPDTIKNRCQVFNFNRISSDKICNRLKYICNSEGVTNYEEACDYLSRICNNQMRDGISLLSKCLGYRNIGTTDLSLDTVLMALGDYSFKTYFELINNIVDGNNASVLQTLSNIYNQGTDMKLFVDQFLSFVLDLYKYSLMKDYRVTKIPGNMEEDLKYATGFENNTNVFNKCSEILLELKNMLKTDVSINPTIEVMFIKMIREIV